MSMLSEIIFNAGGGKRQSIGQWKMFKALPISVDIDTLGAHPKCGITRVGPGHTNNYY